ncbi:putative F-box protein [Senna tora]|uniref:Putative F-box protein n=1 Tax=Senna tora TaxID=362788 RepID=A0A834X2M1_9FABA|nr:putative F-box protein [Senna tora]
MIGSCFNQEIRGSACDSFAMKMSFTSSLIISLPRSHQMQSYCLADSCHCQDCDKHTLMDNDDYSQLSECTWTKVLEISAEAMGLSKNVEIRGFTIMNNGDYLIFATKEEIGQHHFLNVCFTPFSTRLPSIGHAATAMPL